MKPVFKKILITEVGKRASLVEGRDRGLGFAFALPDTKNTFKTIMAYSACKDYLNDVVFVENTKKSLPLVYGFHHQYGNIWGRNKFVYLAVKIINKKGANPKVSYTQWDHYAEFKKIFEGNFTNLISAINKMEEYYNLNSLRSSIEGVYTNKNNEQELIIKMPKVWASKTYLISTYTLFLRTHFNVTKAQLKKDYKSLLENQTLKVPFKLDYGLFGNLKETVKLKEKGKFNQNFNMFLEIKTEDVPEAQKTIVHNGGVMNYLKKINA